MMQVKGTWQVRLYDQSWWLLPGTPIKLIQTVDSVAGWIIEFPNPSPLGEPRILRALVEKEEIVLHTEEISMANDRHDQPHPERKTVAVPSGQYEVGFDGFTIAFLPLGGTYGPQPADTQINVPAGLYDVAFDGISVTFEPVASQEKSPPRSTRSGFPERAQIMITQLELTSEYTPDWTPWQSIMDPGGVVTILQEIPDAVPAAALVQFPVNNMGGQSKIRAVVLLDDLLSHGVLVPQLG